ncbi:hypothetical protein CV83915_2p0005 (plasmid) [Escherichia coli]|uniref:Uncharacterized protein n=1 Tax=Escherichia coli TaxID=562 RepID=A0A2H4TKD5_ECOLX|nr:hypothetical protein CV83915_2p0005 [Escherichia coli]
MPIRYVGTIGGKLKVTQLSTTGYLGNSTSVPLPEWATQRMPTTAR